MGIQIELKDPDQSYKPGEVVEGRVIVNNSKVKSAKEVVISLEGKAEVEWKEKEKYKDFITQSIEGQLKVVSVDRTRTVSYNADESYLNSGKCLAGDGNNAMTLPQGTLSYPFSFLLPPSIPSSFEGPNGKISYVLKGEVRRSLLKFNDKAQLPINVIASFDLNKDAGAKLPQECKTVKEPNMLALRKGTISFEANIPERSGFVPGDIINFQARIQNDSNQKVKSSTANILQIATCYADGRYNRGNKIICSVQGPEVRKGESESWAPKTLIIPAKVPPTKLGGDCKIIDVEYALDFELRISGLSDPLVGQLPIVIGTIPLKSAGKGEDGDSEEEEEAETVPTKFPPQKSEYDRPVPSPHQSKNSIDLNYPPQPGYGNYGYGPSPPPNATPYPGPGSYGSHPPPPIVAPTSAPQSQYWPTSTGHPHLNRNQSVPTPVPQPDYGTTPPHLNRMSNPPMSVPQSQERKSTPPQRPPVPIGFHIPGDNNNLNNVGGSMQMPMVPPPYQQQHSSFPVNATTAMPMHQPQHQPQWPEYPPTHFPPAPPSYMETMTNGHQERPNNWDPKYGHGHAQTNIYAPLQQHNHEYQRRM